MSKKNKHNRWTRNPETSSSQLAANRANAQLSTGPSTPEGRAKSSLNAVKTGLTGRTVLLPADDVAAYEQHMDAYATAFSPIGQLETDLVRSIAETAWRLQRIPSLESSIYAVGAIESADQYEDQDPAVRPSLIQLAVHLKYERQIRNLQLQEARLVRRREKEIAELRQLQAVRKEREQQEVESAIMQAAANIPFFQNGFEFSNSDSDGASDLLAGFDDALPLPEAA